jgi:gliding motility-associated-like protein
LNTRPHFSILFLLLLAFTGLWAQKPVAGFTANKVTGCSPLQVTFTSTSTNMTGPGCTFLWRFGNGNTSTIANSASAIYYLAGSYKVTLVVKNPSGTDSIVKASYITVYAKPVVNFTALPRSGCAPLAVNFTDNTTGTAAIQTWQWDFGDGNLSTAKNPANSYSSIGAFDVTLSVKDVNGCDTFLTKPSYIATSAGFTIGFTANKTILCGAPDSVKFTSTVSVPGTYTYKWTFGDGGTSILANPSHTYTTNGAYSVELEVTSPTGCKQKLLKANYIQIGTLKADFTYTTFAPCAPTNILLTNTSSPNLNSLTYGWTLNGGQPKDTKNPNYLTTVKNNIVSLTVTDAGGCSKTVSKSVTLADGPTADFVASEDTFCSVPADVDFTNTSTGSPVSWAWNFGNSIGVTTKNPSTTYNTPGDYKVRLIATDAGGCKDTMTRLIKVSKPNASIEKQNQKKGCAPVSFHLKVIDNTIPALTSWKWTLNNAVVSTAKEFDYNFTASGIYVFKATGTNSLGCLYEGYDTVKVGEMPDFSISVDKIVVCYNPGVVTFLYHQIGSVVADKIVWEIAGSQNTIYGEGDTVRVRLPDTGWYSVKVTASNNGCEKTVIIPKMVNDITARARFLMATDKCKPDSVIFTNKSEGNNTYLWDFGDGIGTSTKTNPKYLYQTPGWHTVALMAKDLTTTCADTLYANVYIITPPIVSFLPHDTSICRNAPLRFTGTAIMDPTRVAKDWFFTSSNSVTVQNNPATFSFPLSGKFTVVARIKDDQGCTYLSPDTSHITIYDGKPDFLLSPKFGCTPLTISVKDTSETDNAIIGRSWQFSPNPADNFVSPSPNASFTYHTPAINQNSGTQVILTVTDIKGCTFTTSKTVTNIKPLPTFSIGMVRTCQRDSFIFKPTVDSKTVCLPATFNWSLPFNETSTAKDIFRGYTADTTFDVKLVITDSAGCKDSITKPITINTKLPVIGMDATPRDIKCYKTKPTVFFTDTSIAGGSPILRREWRLGNTSNSIIKIGKDSIKTSAVYQKPGRYPVSLHITDSLGCKDSITIPDFVVVGGPYGDYTFTPTKGCSPVEVKFKVTSPNAALYVWDFADGKVDSFTVDTTTYLYDREGIYLPRITLIDSTGNCEYGLDAKDTLIVWPLPKPDFDVNKNYICKGGIITFTNQTAAHPVAINKWKWMFSDVDSSALKVPPPVPFDSAGYFTIKLEATDINGCYGFIQKDSFITVVDDTVPPAIPLIKRATVQNNEEVLFEYAPNAELDFGQYIIYAGSRQFFKTDINDTSLLDVSLNTLENTYWYNMVAVDVCNNVSDMSETHQTVELKAQPSVNSVELNWTAYQGFDTSKVYEIWRSTETDPYLLLTTVSGDSTHFIDTSVLCHQTYFYHIRTVETDSLLQFSWSDTSGASPVYVPVLPVPENIRATVHSNKFVRLEWHLAKHNRVFKYHIYRSIDSGQAVLYKTFESTDTVLTDVEVDVQEHSYAYTTYVVDACGGQSSPSNIARTIVLRVRMVGNDILKHDPKLTWSRYEQWANGIDHYVADFYNDEQEEFEVVSINAPDQLDAQHRYINLSQKDYCYKITAFQKGDTTIFSESNINCVSTAPRLYAPNVFTINGDNLNDIFYIQGVFVEQFELKIYNRWGGLVFQTNDMYQGWDGTFEGQPCKPDVFVYMAEGIGRRGERTNITGNVTLLR